jgi:hypothetical protein
MQPAQQQGRRMPPRIFDSPFLMRISRVSDSLPEVTQQIHSLRESGVMSCQSASTFLSAAMAARKSFGIVCTVPPAIAVAMQPLYKVPYAAACIDGGRMGAMPIRNFLYYITNNEDVPRHEAQFDIAFFIINTLALIGGSIALWKGGEGFWIPFLIIEYTWALDTMRHNRP